MWGTADPVMLLWGRRVGFKWKQRWWLEEGSSENG